MTDRVQEIKSWVSSLIPEKFTIEQIPSDASARKYHRVSTASKTFVVMDTVPGEELLRFAQISEILEPEINVPSIIAKNFDKGLLLICDFGNITYLSELEKAKEQESTRLYFDAIATICNLQKIECNLPIMNGEYIDEKLEVFTTWYLDKHLNIEIDAALLKQLSSTFKECFLSVPPVFVHLDYHSRNLMVVANNNPGVIDYQDAMLGPATYDLVSLLQDAYITWPRNTVEQWVGIYADIKEIEFNKDLLKQFDIVGLQRHIKNLGVFARLNYRDNKPNYLTHIPVLLDYIIETCERYPELKGLLAFMKTNILETRL